MTSDDVLIKASADLARFSPELWRKFITGLEIHTMHVRDLLVNSPADTLPVLQGHAREAAHLLKTLQNCVQTADKLKGK